MIAFGTDQEESKGSNTFRHRENSAGVSGQSRRFDVPIVPFWASEERNGAFFDTVVPKGAQSKWKF